MQTVLQTARGPFLILTPVCVLTGIGAVAASGDSISLTALLLVLTGALCAHISVNALNEYLDFRSGLDLHTRRTPFSGGSGALPRNPGAAGPVLAFGVVTLLITVLIGLYFLWQGEYGLLPLGLAGVLIIIFYTRQINRLPWLCLIAPGTGFGLAMVAGTAYAMGSSDSTTLWLAALVPFFLVNNLLLLNQYPDIAADKAAGRYHFPIAYGVARSTQMYGLFLLASAAVIIAGAVSGWFPLWSLLSLLPLALGVIAWQGARKLGDKIGEQPQFMAANVGTTLLTPAVLGLSLLLG
ncbi:MAG: prenyltransferase [Pseudomonadota bacterium]|nr:prenyltransferase [Pseudomonadota bacterium]